MPRRDARCGMVWTKFPVKVKQVTMADSQSPQLTPHLLLRAYAAGYFPMGDPETGEIDWYHPDPRGHLPLDGFRVSASLGRTVRRGVFEIRADTAFEEVMRACAQPRRTQRETWISEEIIGAYAALHRRGFAHSVEAWREGRLVGGLYGVSIRGAFFGESMFSRSRDASTAALAALVVRMRERGFCLLDIQFMTPHLRRFGADEIPRRSYLELLRTALAIEAVLHP